MTKNVIFADTSDHVLQSMSTMIKAKIHHLPVVEDDELAGVVSLRDLVQAAYQEDEQQIQYMNEYMYGPGC